MKWILVWWVIHPHYMVPSFQRGFESEAACIHAGQLLEAPKNTVLHFHCGME